MGYVGILDDGYFGLSGLGTRNLLRKRSEETLDIDEGDRIMGENEKI